MMTNDRTHCYWSSDEGVCHVRQYTDVTVASTFAPYQAIPEVTEQKGSLSELRYLNHTGYWMILKMIAKMQGERER